MSVGATAWVNMSVSMSMSVSESECVRACVSCVCDTRVYY